MISRIALYYSDLPLKLLSSLHWSLGSSIQQKIKGCELNAWSPLLPVDLIGIQKLINCSLNPSNIDIWLELSIIPYMEKEQIKQIADYVKDLEEGLVEWDYRGTSTIGDYYSVKKANS